MLVPEHILVLPATIVGGFGFGFTVIVIGELGVLSHAGEVVLQVATYVFVAVKVTAFGLPVPTKVPVGLFSYQVRVPILQDPVRFTDAPEHIEVLLAATEVGVVGTGFIVTTKGVFEAL